MRIPSIDELMNHFHDSLSKESIKEALSCFTLTILASINK